MCQVVSVDAIVAFMRYSDKAILVLTTLSSIVQFYVIYMAVHHIRRRTGDQWMHVFLLSMTVSDALLTCMVNKMDNSLLSKSLFPFLSLTYDNNILSLIEIFELHRCYMRVNII